MTLPAVAGHRRARAAFTAAHTRASLPAVLLLHGLAGAGKQRTALWIGQLAHCRAPGPQGPCDTCRSCRMRVGALPQNPTGLPGYTFNWSPETPCPETWMLHHIGRARHDV